MFAPDYHDSRSEASYVLLIAPITAFLLVFRVLHRNGRDWRVALLASAVFCGVAVAGITEALSLPRLITRETVASAWIAVCILAFFTKKIMDRRATGENSRGDAPPAPLERETRLLLAGAGGIVLIVAVVALVSAPNVWDAMEYHLPRVVMWMSQHSVRFYATPDYAQLMFGPWAEFTMMHADLLAGGDRFVNFIELASMVGSCVAVSVIARSLGAGVRGQALAAVVCATIPEGVLEASGPMNTYVVSFWIAVTVAFIFAFHKDASWLNLTCAGSAAGLAVLTKGSSYVYLPLIVLACWLAGPRPARVRFLQRIAVFVALIVAINLPQYVRCYDMTGSPLGLPFADGGPRLHWMAGVINPRATVANMIRNASLHFSTPSKRINTRLEGATRLAIANIGVNPDDPREIWPGDNFHLSNFSFHEIHAGNPLHLLLLLAAMGFLLSRRLVLKQPAAWYALGIAGAFLFFCALLRWQTWGSRHHLPLFVLGSVLVALVLELHIPRKWGTAIAVLLLLSAGPFAVANRTRSLVRWQRVDDVYHPRSVLYFSDQHEALATATIAAANAVNHSKCTNIAIDSFTPAADSKLVSSPPSFYVYPMLSLIGADGRAKTVWYTGVHNLTKRYEESHLRPCAVICLDCASHPEKVAQYESSTSRASVFDSIVVFSPTGDSPTLAGNAAGGN